MKVLLDVEDSRAVFILELLGSLPFVKVKIISGAKAEILKDLKASVEEVKLAKAGKKKLRTLKESLDEL